MRSAYSYEEIPIPMTLTGEELAELGDIGPAELVKGELVFMSPSNYWHGIIESNIGAILRDFVERHELGKVLTGDAGIYTRRDPDSVRGADVAFISYQRLSRVRSENYLDVAPELVVEILSPGNRWTEMADKLDEYFGIGVRMVWIADPKRKQIFVYHSPTQAERFAAKDRLTGKDVLPGFSVSVAEIFETKESVWHG